MIDVPSGRKFTAQDLQIVEALAFIKFIEWTEEPFPLTPKSESRIYVMGRQELASHPDVGWLLGRKLARLVRSETRPTDERQPCLLGIPIAGNTFAAATSFVSCGENITTPAGQLVAYRLVRETPKRDRHNPKQEYYAVGRPQCTQRYWWIDNTVTDGDMKFSWNVRLSEEGYPLKVMPGIIAVDREQGGLLALARAGFMNVHALYLLRDLLHLFGKLKLWPEERVRRAVAEIETNQLVT